MPYYGQESFYWFLKEYVGNDKNRIILRVTSDVIGIVFDAYIKTGFSHGYLLSQNIVLADLRKRPLILIDFEKSTFNEVNKLSRFWRDLGDLLGEIASYVFTRELDEISRVYITMNHAYRVEPTSELIQKLQNKLIKLTFFPGQLVEV
jgi:hypothetical protein